MLDKTLIILDTNKIRHTNYVGFELGGDYARIRDFIKENSLENHIELAIPEHVVKEVNQQKVEQYQKDVKSYTEVTEKLSALNLVKKQKLATFDAHSELEKQSKKFLAQEGVRVLELSKKDYTGALEKIVDRAIKKELPFKRNNNHSDIGFKDVLIWETILHNKIVISWQDNIFYLSGDNGFSDCKTEFEKVHNKNFEFFNSVDFLIERLEVVYVEQIENKELFSLVDSSYFDDQIKDYIQNNVGVWEYEGEEFDIIDIVILNKCTEFEKIEGDPEIGIEGVFIIQSYVELHLEREDGDGKIIDEVTDTYITTTIDQNNEFIDFELE